MNAAKRLRIFSGVTPRDPAPYTLGYLLPQPLGAALVEPEKAPDPFVYLVEPEKAPDPFVYLMTFPREHWTRIRSNNVLERAMKEIRRRTRVVGSFPDGRSALMLVAARLRHLSGTK